MDDLTPSSSKRKILLRLGGELCIKSPKTRRRFLTALCRNVRTALASAGISARVHHEWSRVLVETSDVVTARELLRHIFGVHTVCDMVEVDFESLSALVQSVVPLARDRVTGRTFAVRGRRHGEHSFHFADLAQQLGGALLPFSSGVNLDHPEVALVVVDVREPDEGPLVGDLSLPHSRATEAAARLDREATYVLVCATGRRSLAMAQDLSRMGFRAYSLVGGVRRLPEAAA